MLAVTLWFVCFVLFCFFHFNSYHLLHMLIRQSIFFLILTSSWAQDLRGPLGSVSTHLVKAATEDKSPLKGRATVPSSTRIDSGREPENSCGPMENITPHVQMCRPTVKSIKPPSLLFDHPTKHSKPNPGNLYRSNKHHCAALISALASGNRVHPQWISVACCGCALQTGMCLEGPEYCRRVCLSCLLIVALRLRQCTVASLCMLWSSSPLSSHYSLGDAYCSS